MKTFNTLTICTVVLSMLMISSAFAENEKFVPNVSTMLSNGIEDSLLSSVKYDEITTCQYFMYDDETGQDISDDPLPSATLEKAKELLKNLSMLDGSFLGFDPPNNKTVQFIYDDEVGLLVDILNIKPGGSYTKEVTMDEAIQILEIVYFGRNFSKIEGLVFESF